MSGALLKIGIGALIGAGAMTLSGCFALHGPIDVKNNIARTNGVRIKQEFGLSARGSTLRLARGIATQFTDEKIPRMAGIRRVQFGEYKIVGGDENPAMLLNDLEISGWEPVVRIIEPGSAEETRVFVREWNGTLRGILFVQRSGDELMLARVKGNLDNALANIMEDMGDKVDMGGLPIFAGRKQDADDVEPLVDIEVEDPEARREVNEIVNTEIRRAVVN